MWAEALWIEAGIPSWDAALATSWWRLAGHIARLVHRDPETICERVLPWRDVWWKRAMRQLLTQRSAPHRTRLGTPVPGRPKRSWDEPLRLTVNAELSLGGTSQKAWQEWADDKDTWKRTETAFVASRLRRVQRPALPGGRLLMLYE